MRRRSSRSSSILIRHAWPPSSGSCSSLPGQRPIVLTTPNREYNVDVAQSGCRGLSPRRSPLRVEPGGVSDLGDGPGREVRLHRRVPCRWARTSRPGIADADGGILSWTDSHSSKYWDQMRGDPRSIDELVSTALTESDEDVAWNAVCTLHFRGTREVLARAGTLCCSDCVAERCLGANRYFGQLGVPERTYPRECLSILLGMLDGEEDADVLQAILVALSHLGEADAIEPASRYRGHPDSEVRHGVVLALTGYDDQRAVDALIELSHDQDAHVRDWATFALGQQIDLDTSVIRETLADRLNDTDYDTRCEAIIGLAKRRDHRVIPIISKELASDWVGCSVVEAAAMIPDPHFYPQLIALREVALRKLSDASEERPGTWAIAELDEAIKACSPHAPSDNAIVRQ